MNKTGRPRMMFLLSRSFGRLLFGSLPCAWLLLAGLTAGTARASIMLALDLPDLVRQADHIAIVDVVSVRAAWDDAHARIYSTIDLKAVEVWKTSPTGSQAAGDHLTVVQLGGTVGDISMTVTGLGSFLPGERSLVFLRGPADHAQVVGMTQGKRSLRYAGASRQWLVAPPNLRQAKLLRPAGPLTSTPLPLSTSARSTPLTTSPPLPVQPGVTGAGPSPAKEMALDDLHGQVQRLMVTTTQP